MSSKSTYIEPRRLKGFRDYGPGLMAERQRILSVIRRQAKLAGFQEIGTPALELAEVLLGSGGSETDKEVYRFRDHGERDVALRFDLTVPFARYVAENQGQMTFPFKRLQIGDVWRGENTQKGRYREFCQCDFDIIGADGATADVEIMATVLRTLGVAVGVPVTMAVGHRAVLSALIRGGDGAGANTPCLCAPAAVETQVLVAIDKLGKIGVEGVAKILNAIPGIDVARVPAFLGLLMTKDSAGNSDLTKIRERVGTTILPLDLTARLEETLRLTRDALGSSTLTVRLDLTIARGLGYYTGIVFETTLDALPGFGAIASGGRYDGLVSRFSARPLGGVGVSIGLDRLLAGLEELGLQTNKADGPIFVAIATEDARGYALSIVKRLRDAGLATDIALNDAKIGNQFKHADRLGSNFVLTVGSNELQNQTIAIKNMRTGQETRDVPLNQLERHLILPS